MSIVNPTGTTFKFKFVFWVGWVQNLKEIKINNVDFHIVFVFLYSNVIIRLPYLLLGLLKNPLLQNTKNFLDFNYRKYLFAAAYLCYSCL